MSLAITALTSPVLAIAQSTPTELADLSLEALLDFDFGDNTGDKKSRKSWKFDYSYHRLSIGGYKIGTKDVSFDDVLFTPGETRTGQNYPVVPTFITQEVHGFSASYALSEQTALSILVPYILQATDHISILPGFDNFLLKSEGIGDIAFNASHQKHINTKAILKFSAGVRIPVGSINNTGDTPRNGIGTLERLPYTMQIGSGTFDTAFALQYVCVEDELTYGATINSVVRTGKNKNDYRLGNNIGVGLWAQYAFNHWVQPAIRVNVRHIGEIKGRDASLLVPTAFPFPASITNPSNYGGEKANIALSLRSCPKKGCEISFNVEYGKPLYQNLNGVQPKEKSNFSIGAAIKF
ncbi:MAG: hypothetical protein COB36_13605 [Alphaproteobacteria bacterium]|nr:MAG: hypothetical protein COB36_13605 [Alphaproteobacteria bacterium]